jgi:CubicO group peptidase (beta-lactamase class C family)
MHPSLFRAIVVTIAMLVAGAGSPVAGQDRPIVNGETGRKLDEYMSRLERLGYSGGALALRGRDVLLEKAYGMADREKGVRLATNSVFNLGSITKSFTAAAILTLETQGKLSVSDPIGKYFDGVPTDKTAITLHHLLTHSSGLESDFSPTDYDPVGREEYVRRALASTLLFAPGSGYEYSNAGYSLLAAVVEKVSGQAYESYLIEKVLKPAGMTETGYKAPGWAAARVAHGYRDGQDWGTILERIQPPDAPYWMLRGNGGLHTTMADMLAWHRALGTDAVLSKEARAKYFKPYVAEGPRGLSHYAYGWAVSRSRRGTAVVQHNGGNGIYVAEFVRFPDEDAMLFVTSTDAGMRATPVVETLERILFGEPVTMPPAVVDVPAPRLASLAGRWQLPNGGLLMLRAEPNALAAQPAGEEALAALLPPGSAELADRLARTTARTADISARAFKGDVSGLHEAMGGGTPIEQVRRQEAEMMRDRESRFGTFKGSVVLGTIPRDGDIVQSIVRLDFEKTSVFNVYAWGPMRLLGIRGMPQLPATRFVPVSDREFVVFSLDAESPAARLRVEDRDGEPVLVFETAPGRTVVARREK